MNKMPVVGVKERITKRVYVQVVLPNEEGKKTVMETTAWNLDKIFKDKTTVASDGFFRIQHN